MTRRMRPYRTDNQKEVMGIVLRLAGEGKVLSTQELWPLMPMASRVSYGALRKVIERLDEQGMVVREKRGNRTYIIPTQKGFDWFRPAH